jgi:hypothetical protein
MLHQFILLGNEILFSIYNTLYFHRHFLFNFYFWVLYPVACIIKIVGNTVPATISIVVHFLLFLTPATCFGLYLTIHRRNIQIWILEIITYNGGEWSAS